MIKGTVYLILIAMLIFTCVLGEIMYHVECRKLEKECLNPEFFTHRLQTYLKAVLIVSGIVALITVIVEMINTWHRLHRKHHLDYPGKKDYLEMMIDWECSRFTKENASFSAYMNFKRKEHLLSEKDCIGIKKTLFRLGLLDKHGEVKLENVK